MTDEKKLTRRGFFSALAGVAGARAIWQLKAQKEAVSKGPGPIPPGADRLPPGQHWVKELVEYSAGGRPGIDAAAWRLTVEGLVTKPLSFTLAEFGALPHVELVKDFHCVTTWSVKDCRWSGVRLADLLKQADPIGAASHVFVECLGGYSTNFPLPVALGPDVLLADRLGGAPLEHRLGGPVRLVVPRLYAYKSAKWVARVMLMAGDKQGYWERNGYSTQADPWRGQRTSADDM